MAGDKRPISVRLFARTQVNAATGCIEWTGQVDESGYGLIRNNVKRERVHRVAYDLVAGPIPEGMLVCHRCDNRICINFSHLFLGTIQDNTADKVAKGRQAKGAGHGKRQGEAHPLARLSAQDIADIRATYMAKKTTQHELAERYGIHQSQVSNIVNNKRWKE